jgi:hypothetical protein
LKKKRLSCLQKKVIAWKHVQRKRNARLITPAFKFAAAYPGVPQATKAIYLTVKWSFGCVLVSLINAKVRPQDGDHNLHEFRIFCCFVWSAVHVKQFDYEFGLWQGMDWPVSRRELRRAIRRDKKANRQNAGLFPEMTR